MLNETENRILAPNETPVLAVVARNSLANLAKMAALSVTVFLLPPILVRVLDKPTYATWMLILQIGTYVALFDGSIQSAISRFVARSRGLKDDLYMGQMLSSAGLIMLFAGFLTVILTILGAWQLDRLFPGIPPSIGTDAQQALLIFGMSLALSIPFSTLAGAFLGLQMNQVNAVAGSVGKILGAAGAAWAAYHHQGLVAMAVWTAAGNLLQGLLYLLAWKQLRLTGFLHLAHVTRTALKEFVSFCYAIFATQSSAILITGLDIPIVAAFDFHSAAYYAIAATISTMLSVPQGAVVTTLIPVASGMSALETPQRLGQLVLKTTRYSTAILCLLALPLFLGMSPFLRLWVGSDYAIHAFPIAILLVIAQFIRLTLLPYAAFVFATGQQHRMLISPLGEGVVNLGCSLVGAHFLGATGVALGTLIGACAGVLLHAFNSMPRTDSMSFKRSSLVLTGILKPIFCCLPTVILALTLINNVPSLIVQIMMICSGELLTVFALWKLNFDARERNEIVGLVLHLAHA